MGAYYLHGGTTRQRWRGLSVYVPRWSRRNGEAGPKALARIIPGSVGGSKALRSRATSNPFTDASGSRAAA